MAHLWFVRYAFAVATFIAYVDAAVTIYRPNGISPTSTATNSASSATHTGGAALNDTVLKPPAPPKRLNRDFVVQLSQSGIDGLSVPQTGSYLGFSIDLSVVNRVVGTNSSILAVPFLNHIANVANRGGSVRVRVGGQTQDNAILRLEGLPGGKIIKTSTAGTTNVTSHVEFAPDLVKMLANVASLVRTEVFLGLNFNNITDPSNAVAFAALAEQTLGSNLHGLALGNEPDLYDRPGHGERLGPYTIEEYMTEWGGIVNALATNSGYTNKQMLMGPSTCCSNSNPDWDNVDLAKAGYLQRFANELKIVTVQRYPTSNCGAGEKHIPQEIYPNFLSHNLLSQHASEYLEFSGIVQAANKPLYMLETNTGACGGFPGISDSFGAGLWAVDWALKLATTNFTTTLLHVGGQGDLSNPFTPPPPDQSNFLQWTTGSVYYSTLIVAEAFGKSGNARIADLNANNGENLTPGYVIYENGAPTRVLLINYVDDATGAHDVTARIAIGGGGTGQTNTTPQQVRVKYFEAPSVSFQGNMTWANQTLGNHFESDGRLTGIEVVHTITCESGSCLIPLKAPSLALVFLSDGALTNSSPAESATLSFATSYLTEVTHTASINQSVLATSNGRGGNMPGKLGSTSSGSIGGTAVGRVIPGLGVLAAVMFGAVVVGFGGRW